MIQVEQLTKVYGNTAAIDGLDFRVNKGEIIGFLGPNGAGKSTTMRILAGALGASSGRALIGGVDVFRHPRKTKRMVGYLPEFPPLYTDMTVRSFLRFAARVKGAATPKENVERVIGRVGLEPVAHRIIDHLSKGYRQRVGIAQALVHDPSVLILDEPASGLDPGQRVEIWDLVRELAQGEVTVVLSTHVLSEVEALCSRVIIIDHGRILAQDTLEHLAGAGASVFLQVARPEEGLRQALIQVEGVTAVEPSGRGLQVRSSRDVRQELAAAAVPYGLLELRARQGLEDVFLKLTGGKQ